MGQGGARWGWVGWGWNVSDGIRVGLGEVRSEVQTPRTRFAVAESFSEKEISTRLNISDACCVITQDCIIRGGVMLPLYERVAAAVAAATVDLRHSILTVVMPAKGGSALPPTAAAAVQLAVPLQSGSQEWGAFLLGGERLGCGRHFSGVQLESSEYINILFSSGTTGEPKAVPWGQCPPLHLSTDLALQMDLQKGDVLCWPTSLGWVMGPCIIFGALLNGASLAIFEGAPHLRGLGCLVQDASVSHFGSVPALQRAWRSSGCMDGLDWSGVKAFASTGEATRPEDAMWLMSRAAGYRRGV